MKQLTSLIFRWNWIRFTDWLPRQKSLNFWTKIMKIGHSGVSHSFGHKCPSAGINEDLYLDNAATPQLFGNIWWVLKSSISCPSYSLVLSLAQEVLREESQIAYFCLTRASMAAREVLKNAFYGQKKERENRLCVLFSSVRTKKLINIMGRVANLVFWFS